MLIVLAFLVLLLLMLLGVHCYNKKTTSPHYEYSKSKEVDDEE